MNSQIHNSELKKQFSLRMHELCEEKGMPIHGRQTMLAGVFKVSQEAARKWLEAEAIPTYERLDAICAHFAVNFEWLVRGKGPKRYTEGLYITDPLTIHVAKEMESMKEYAKQEIVDSVDSVRRLISHANH